MHEFFAAVRSARAAEPDRELGSSPGVKFAIQKEKRSGL
jgi:hypothetical protein